ncbi:MULTISPECIES: hypothetical protein [unclassified Moritella]|uniref:hypothetical protein n=1 Tax=unclassified Moritella TaxID=2637987 RepID=UPI001BA5B1A4|nr:MULTISPECIES: hypothetical protein [unclassified Moritella]QUM83779.1 hypothetical protein HWV02_04190 [Moritella sp. 28]QUM88069.1 hypothetical protein HWV03_04145 [Moritella sp. 36]
MFKFLLPVLILISWFAQAEDNEALTVDRAVSQNIQLAFPNDYNVDPKIGDFEIVNYILMSNDAGERWAVITLTNLSSGNREFNNEHLIALFADGSRMSPLQYKLNFRGRETQSITVSFGEHKFPILSISSRN